MAQISRPFQIALAAVALLGIVWVLALHKPSGSSSSAKATAEQEVAAAGKAGGSGNGSYHGSAPGVAGLTNDVAKAHGAVSTSQQNAKQLEQKSAQASSSAAPAASAATGTGSAATPAKTSTAAAPTVTVTTTHHVVVHSTAALTAARQRLVEAELRSGRVVVLLFWNSKGADDVAVERAVEQLAQSDHGVAVHVSAANQVATFGTITRGVQVYGTPTILIVAKSGQTQTLTGLQDAYAIRQAISQVSHP